MMWIGSHCLEIALAPLDFGLMEVQPYLAADGCSNNALKPSFVNIYFSQFSHKCRCGLLHMLQRKSIRLPKTSSNKSCRFANGNCVSSCFVLGGWGFTVTSVRNHDDNFTYEHMFVISWEEQISGMQWVYFAVVWELCSDSGCGSQEKWNIPDAWILSRYSHNV